MYDGGTRVNGKTSRERRRLSFVVPLVVATLVNLLAGCDQRRATPTTSVTIASAPVLANTTTTNAMKWQDLVGHPLSTESLAGAQFADLLKNDWNLRSLMKYFVECALPQGQSVSMELGGEKLTIEGWSGLAPQWQSGPCDKSCQRWVSACLLARTNAYGIPVRIQMRAPSPTHYDDTGKAPEELFVVEEGAFFGNIFKHPMRRYSCRGRGFDPFMMTFRNCAMADNGCGIMHLGTCGDHDGTIGGPGDRVVCEDFDAKQGVYKRCHNRSADAGTGAFPAEGEVYEEVVTLWVKRTRFVQEQTAPTCADPPSPGPAPYMGPAKATGAGSKAGQHCTTEDDCDGGAQVCSRQSTYGVCTQPCNHIDDSAAEAKQCGGAGTTCLNQIGGGLCTRTCKKGLPSGTEGGCSKYQVCTGLWLFNNPNDAPGCYVHCSDNTDCWPFIPCNRRTGACGAVADESALPDGQRCSLFDKEGNQQNECRGFCWPVGSNMTKGICASWINRARTKDCPDDPEHIKPAAPEGDDMALCAFRACQFDVTCPWPLKCMYNWIADKKVCTNP